MLTEVDYQQALSLLTGGSFSQARSIFESLGDYKDSWNMLLEVDYQQALFNLGKWRF